MPHSTPAVTTPRAAGRLRVWCAAFSAVALGVTPRASAGILDWLFHHDVQVITSTDAMPAAALLRGASPDHPVFYVAGSVGYHDFGGAIAGDKLPESGMMVRTIVRTLAKSGFLPASPQHPATELIVFAWGTLYPMTLPSFDPSLPDVQTNRFQMMRFLGGDKLGLIPDEADQAFGTAMPGLTRFNPDAEAIANVATDDLYVVALAAYEFPVKNRRRPVLLWRTKISCPARGLVMADTLPTMLAIAAPYIGHETGAPVWINASDKFRPDVRIGNPKFEEYLDSTPTTVLEKSAAAAKHSK